jgi:hypothetical protein
MHCGCSSSRCGQGVMPAGGMSGTCGPRG